MRAYVKYFSKCVTCQMHNDEVLIKLTERMVRGYSVWPFLINSLAPGKFGWNFRYLTFQIISVIVGWLISNELALRSMSLDLSDDKSTLVQVMTWCRQATSHYLSQCWPRSMPPYGVTRPQWDLIVFPVQATIQSKIAHGSILRIIGALWLESRPSYFYTM